MIIGCPSCQTRFKVDSAKLQPAGRNVRCAKCGHRWHQMPDDGSEAMTLSEVAPPQFGAPDTGEVEDHPPSPPETPAEMAESLAAIAEQVTGARGDGQRGDGYTVSEAPRAQPQNPIQRVVQRTGAPTGPITVPPRMRPMRPAKRRPYLGLILIAGFIIGLLIALYVFRETIARTIPGAEFIYSLLHLSTDDPTADLEISIEGWNEVAGENGNKIFQVRATIFNKSEYPVPVPPLMMTPLDANGASLDPILFRVREETAEPGQNIKFQKSFDKWPAAATSLVLTFATQP